MNPGKFNALGLEFLFPLFKGQGFPRQFGNPVLQFLDAGVAVLSFRRNTLFKVGQLLFKPRIFVFQAGDTLCICFSLFYKVFIFTDF